MHRSIPLCFRAVASLGFILLAGTGPVMAQQMPMSQLGMSEMPGGGNELMRKLLPSVVSINVRKDVVQTEPGMNAAGSAAEVRQSFGSGFVIDQSGVIATNS